MHPWRSCWCTRCWLNVLLLHSNTTATQLPACPLARLAQLLVHPLVRRRSGLLAAALEFATLPILLFKPAGSDISSLVAAAQSGGLLGGPTSSVSGAAWTGDMQLRKISMAVFVWLHMADGLPRAPAQPCAAGTQLCGALLTFFQVALIVVLPTLASLHCWQPPPVPAPQLLAGLHAAAPALTARRYWQRTTVEWAPRRRLSSTIARSFDAASRALRFCLRTPAGLTSRMFVCYWLLAITWWLCKRSHGLH